MSKQPIVITTLRGSAEEPETLVERWKKKNDAPLSQIMEWSVSGENPLQVDIKYTRHGYI